MAGLDTMSMVLGGLMGGGKGGASSSSSSNASNVLNLAFNPNVFASTGDGTYTPSSSGNPSGSATGTPSSSAGNSSPSSIPWAYGSGAAARYGVDEPYTGAKSASAGGNNSMLLMLMLGIGALYIVSRS
ncbi:hypothetical protein WV31_07435 [Magnetospirillum sp. ME-1]|uniref:hypothetical protein n=1 Tax=Magnetospirillum sp. ME-1 TaxID=1639348 RepID=UPI000A17B943|nr:hypothetical protein [Magnetospirillum sp. ME-1]ARJ65496.1 hypothetical protein WV31_07435 [Magnetospirillum sp. ME-1]